MAFQFSFQLIILKMNSRWGEKKKKNGVGLKRLLFEFLRGKGIMLKMDKRERRAESMVAIYYEPPERSALL